MAEGGQELTRVLRRLEAVEAVETVMRAVWALARAQQPQVEAAAAHASAWLDVAEDIVARLAGEPVSPEDPAEVLWVLVGPERAFCGPLARMLLDQLPPEGPVGLAGRRLVEVATWHAGVRDRIAFSTAAASTPEELGARADALAAEILAMGPRTVVLLHPDQGTAELHRSVLLAGRRAPVAEPPETFLPAEEVLEAAVLEAVAGRLAVAMAEALRAEVRARLVAAEAARTSCGRQLDSLDQQRRVLRQGAITAELLELAGARRRRS